MIAIKEQMIQTSPLDLKGCDCCALSFLIPAHAHAVKLGWQSLHQTHFAECVLSPFTELFLLFL